MGYMSNWVCVCEWWSGVVLLFMTCDKLFGLKSQAPHPTKPFISCFHLPFLPLKTLSIPSFLMHRLQIPLQKFTISFFSLSASSIISLPFLLRVTKSISCYYTKWHDHHNWRCMLSKMEKQGTCNTNSWTQHKGCELRELSHSFLLERSYIFCSELVLHVPLFPIMSTAPYLAFGSV